MRPLKIALLTRAFPALSETFVRDHVRQLERRGHQVDVYSLYVPTAPALDEQAATREICYLIGPETSLGRAVLRATGRFLLFLASPTALMRLLPLTAKEPRIVAEAIHGVPRLRGRGTRYDVIHAHFGPTGMLAVALRRARVLTGPVVTTFHGYDLTSYPIEKGPGAYAFLFGSGDWFTVNSHFTKARAVDLGAPEERTTRIPMGVDLSRFPFRQRSHRTDDPLRLLSVGRLEPVKGLRYGLETVSRLVSEELDVRYTIIGTGQLEAELREEAARLGIASRVRFTGPLPFGDVITEYERHDLFLMPGVVARDGQQEAQGRVLVEAQASGMPVVATRVGGIPETLAEGAGRLVEPRDPEALADAIRELADHADRWPEMGARGRRHVEEKFDADRILDDLIDVYRAAIEYRDTART